jgi:hypothetical protein
MRRSDTDFSKGDLKDDLKRAGFEDCVADNIADRVDDRKAKGWTYDVGRQEAIREAELIINSSKAALDNYAGKTAANETTRNESMRARDEMGERQVTKTVLKAP